MKAILVIGLIGLAVWFGWKLSNGQLASNNKNESTAPAEVTGSQLPGLPPSLEGTLQTAQQRGASGLRDFLGRYGKTINDPRRAWIELDYVVLVAKDDPAEARKVFAKVKGRTMDSSPVYRRMKQLEKTYE